MEPAKTKNSKHSMTRAARVALAKHRSRTKGETIETLEKLSNVVQEGLSLLRSPDAGKAPRTAAQLRDMAAGMGRLMSLQQYERGMDAAVKAFETGSGRLWAVFVCVEGERGISFFENPCVLCDYLWERIDTEDLPALLKQEMLDALTNGSGQVGTYEDLNSFLSGNMVEPLVDDILVEEYGNV